MHTTSVHDANEQSTNYTPTECYSSWGKIQGTKIIVLNGESVLIERMDSLATT